MSTPSAADEELHVAIVGMAGRFAGADDLTTLWRNLRGGVDSITHFSREHAKAGDLDAALVDDPSYVAAHGALSHVDRFDAPHFGLGPLEAALMDPQQRVALHVAYAALEDAGLSLTERQTTGVFLSIGRNHYREWLRRLAHTPTPEQQAWLEAGNDIELAAGRVAYALDLGGPCMGLSAGCSSSLAAVYVAYQQLVAWQCDAALVGGVQIQLPQARGYLARPGGVWSHDGTCRVFDRQGTGLVPASGAGFVVLKRLIDARRDGDPIYALLCAAAANHDGAQKASFAAPSATAQAEVIRLAHSFAAASGAEVAYVEAHGAATPMADALEAAALMRAFAGSGAAKGACALGCVKGNLGHAGAAAGIAALIKTALCLHHGELVPTAHFEATAKELDLTSSPFYVNAEVRAWPRPAAECLAGVTAYGAGGTNVHLVLRGAPAVGATTRRRTPTAGALSEARYAVERDCITLADAHRPWDAVQASTTSTSVAAILADLVGLDAAAMRPNEPLRSLGIDSFLLLHVQQRLAALLDRHVTLAALAGCRTVTELEQLCAAGSSLDAAALQSTPPTPTIGYEVARDEAALTRAYAFMQSLEPRDLRLMEPILSPSGAGLMRRDELERVLGRDLYVVSLVEEGPAAEVVGLLLAQRVPRLLVLSEDGVESLTDVTEAYVVIEASARGRVDYPLVGSRLAAEPAARDLGIFPWLFKITCHPAARRIYVQALATALGRSTYEIEALLGGHDCALVYEQIAELLAADGATTRVLAAVRAAEFTGVTGAALLRAPHGDVGEATAALRAIVGTAHLTPLLTSMRAVREGALRLVGFDVRWFEPVFVFADQGRDAT